MYHLNTLLIWLFISVPPNKPVIRDGNGRTMVKKLGPYKVGEKLFAICSTTGGI